LAPRLVSQHRRNWYQMSSQDDSLLHIGIWCKSLVSQVPLKGSKGMESLGPILRTGHLTGYSTMARRLWTTLLIVLTSHLTICVCLNTISSTWPTSNLQQTLTCSKLSPPGYGHWTLSFCMLAYNPCNHNGTNVYANDDYMEVWCLPSATYLLNESQNKVLSIWVSVILFLKTPCVSHVKCKQRFKKEWNTQHITKQIKETIMCFKNITAGHYNLHVPREPYNPDLDCFIITNCAHWEQYYKARSVKMLYWSAILYKLN
jgi:hypothetical protein